MADEQTLLERAQAAISMPRVVREETVFGYLSDQHEEVARIMRAIRSTRQWCGDFYDHMRPGETDDELDAEWADAQAAEDLLKAAGWHWSRAQRWDCT